MKYEILKTGSSGNCIIVEKFFALDIGISYKTIKPYLDDIKLIFISHRHTDHLNKATVKKVAYEYPNIIFIGNEEVFKKLKELGVKRAFKLDYDKTYSMGVALVKLDPLWHDVQNSALHLYSGGKKLLYATDTSQIDHIVAKDYDLYLIEANYETDEELDQKIVEAKTKSEFTHLERVRHTHLSQLQALNWLDKNKGENSKFVFIHEHKEKGE